MDASTAGTTYVYKYELLNLSYDSAERWVAPAVQRGLINPGKRQISVPGGGSTLTHHQISTPKSCLTHLPDNRA